MISELIRAAKNNHVEQLDKVLGDAEKGKFTQDCFSRALKAAVCNHKVKTEIIFKILSFAAHNCCFSNLKLMDCIERVFAQETFHVEIAALLILCWLASAEGENWQLSYFLGISTDDWLPYQSDDKTLDQLMQAFHGQKFKQIR